MSKTLRLPDCEQQALLDQVQVRLVERTELERFKQLLDEHHYLGSLKAVGERLYYVATDAQGQWLALLVFSAPAKHLKHRDQWIGWSGAQRHRRLSLVTNNSRFLILPERSVPNLASKGAAPDPGSASHRLAGLFYGHPVLVGRNLRRCCPVLRYGLFGQRLERTGPDRRLGPPSARLLRETRPAQTPLLPPAVQKRPPQSPSRTSQASVGGGRTKGIATLHTHGQGNPLDGRTLQGSARLSRALRVLSAVVDVNDPFFSHPLRCSARAKGHRQVCPRLEPSPTPGPWNPAQPPRQVSRTDTADFLPSASTRRCP